MTSNFSVTDRELVAEWMIAKGYATGHGDIIEELLLNLAREARERQRTVDERATELEVAYWRGMQEHGHNTTASSYEIINHALKRLRNLAAIIRGTP